MDDQPDKPLLPLRIAGVPEPYNLPWRLGIERRAFLRAGVDLRWTDVGEGTGRMCRMLASGETDLAVLVTEGAVRDIANGGDERIIGTWVESPLTWGVHVPGSSSVHSVDDLGHAPYLVSRMNSGSHVMGTLHAQRQGRATTAADFEVVNDLNGALASMADGRPCAFLWDTFITAKHVTSGAMRAVDEYRPDWPAFVVVARPEVVEQNPKAIATVMKIARDQASGFAIGKNAAQVVADRYGADPLHAAVWLQHTKWSRDGVLPESAAATVAKALHGVALVPGTVEEAIARVLASVAYPVAPKRASR